jgi:hypothetical protein
MYEAVEIFRFTLACSSQSVEAWWWKPTSIAEKETELRASCERCVLHRRVLCREPVPEASFASFASFASGTEFKWYLKMCRNTVPEANEANEANICFICFNCFNCLTSRTRVGTDYRTCIVSRKMNT